MDELDTCRILLLGKSGNGKSSLANIIFGETVFKVKNFNDLNTSDSEARTKRVNGRRLTLIDAPGLFDPGRSEDEVKPELVRCIADCAPGPHVLLIVLKVEKYTEQEQAVVGNVCRYFSGDALKHAAVVFTHGDQLPDGMKIDEYVGKSEGLSELVKECGGRCHVFDCRYWKDNMQEDDYRSNQFQAVELLNTVEKILVENAGGCYTNAALNEMERGIQEEMQRLKLSSKNMSEVEIRKLAKSNVLKEPRACSPWVKGLAVAAAGLFVVVSALFVKSRFGQTITEALPSSLEILDQAAIKTGEATESPVDVVTLVEQGAQNSVFDILDKLQALFERTYNPFNPFE